MTLQELRDARAKAAHEAREIAKTAIDAGRDLTHDEREKATRLVGEVNRLTGEIEQKKADDDLTKTIQDYGTTLGLDGPPAGGGNGGLHVVRGGKSVGQRFVESDAWQRVLKQAPGGNFGKDQRVSSDPVGFKDLLTGGDHDESAGVTVDPDRLGVQVGPDAFQRPLTLRQLVTNGRTGSDTVEYSRFLSMTSGAATVPEAVTAEPIGSGTPAVTPEQAGLKPQSAFTMGRKTAVVKAIANWIPITKRAVSDAAQLLTLIDNFLLYNLEEELENQMLNGDDVGENFEGIANVSGVQLQAYSVDKLVTTRRAKTKVRLIGRRNPNGWVLNPVDVEELSLIRDRSGGTDNTGQFFWGGPASAGGTSTLWGLPVIENETVPAGVGYVGDWTRAILWDREQASVTASDSHQDFFTRNLVAILAEMRAAFGVVQPNAFVKIDLSA